MEEDTWGRWAWVAIVGFLLGYSVFLAVESVTRTEPRSIFVGMMSGIAFVTLGLRR